MKKILLLLSLVLCGVLQAQTYDTISGPDGKLSKYYYPDGWYDTCDIYYETGCTPETNPGMPIFWGGLKIVGNFGYNWSYDLPFEIPHFTAYRYQVNEPMAIVGLAVMIEDFYNATESSAFCCPIIRDTVYPDTLYILNSEMAVIDSVRTHWDTAAHKVLKIPINADSSTYGFRYIFLCELTFDSPVVVDSDYYIVSTEWNKIMYHVDPFSYWLSHPYGQVIILASCPLQHYPGELYTHCNHSNVDEYKVKIIDGKFDMDTVPSFSSGHADWWGPYLLLVDSATIEVESANLAMGTAGPTRRMSKWVSQTITATPEIGYLFSHWNDGSTENPRDIYLTQDTLFTAYFEPNTRHTVRTRCEPEGMGIASGDGQYWRGDTVTLRATPAAPYHFSHWNDGNRTNPRRFAIEQDTAFTAVFTQQLPSDTTLSLPQPLLKEGSPLFTLTPNPTTGEVTVSLGQPPLTPPEGGERMTLTIHDAAGNEVMHKELARPGISIDLSAFPAGAYFVTLATPTASGTQKLVVK